MASRSNNLAAQLKSMDLSKATPYIQRIIEDAKLRENVRTAYDSSRSAYARLSNGKAPTKALLEDKRLQRDLQQAAEALRDATTALTEPPKKPRRARGAMRAVFLTLLAGCLALAASEQLRTKVLDAIFGKEEEFEYTPPPAAASTPPSTPPSSPVGAA